MKVSDSKTNVYEHHVHDVKSAFDWLGFAFTEDGPVPCGEACDDLIMTIADVVVADDLRRSQKAEMISSYVEHWFSYYGLTRSREVMHALDERITAVCAPLQVAKLVQLYESKAAPCAPSGARASSSNRRGKTKGWLGSSKSLTRWKRVQAYSVSLPRVQLRGGEAGEGEGEGGGARGTQPARRGGGGSGSPQLGGRRDASSTGLFDLARLSPERLGQTADEVPALAAGLLEAWASTSNDNFEALAWYLHTLRVACDPSDRNVICARLGLRVQKADQMVRGHDAAFHRLVDLEDALPPPIVLWKLGLIVSSKPWARRLLDELMDHWNEGRVTARQMALTIGEALARAKDKRLRNEGVLWNVKLRTGTVLMSLLDGTIRSQRTGRLWSPRRRKW